MSEADSPNKESGLPESIESVDAGAPTDDSQRSRPLEPLHGDEGWQIVDFPGAIPVSEFPPNAVLASQLNVASNSDGTAAIAPVAVTAPEPTINTAVEQLHQENAALKAQIAQLERDLAQGQIELQLERSRALQEEATRSAQAEMHAAQHVQELTTAQERLNRLMQDLDLSRQAAQRQQILVETLTEQLETSQERIAQLERDCAITQQRFNEQVQQRLQAESACRDLRMRLHRQQQHTLQFKAALEKCLEMPSAQAATGFMANLNLDDAIVESDLDSEERSPESRPVVPKSRPVQPWSAPQEAPGSGLKFASPFSKPLTVPSTAAPVPVDAPEVAPLPQEPLATEKVASLEAAAQTDSPLERRESAQPISHLMNLIFPDAAEPSRYQPDDVPPTDEIFDLSPFFEANASKAELLPEAIPSSTAVSDSIPTASDAIDNSDVATTPPGDDPIWADLAKLIESSTAHRIAAAAPEPPATDATPEMVDTSTDASILASHDRPDEIGLTETTSVIESVIEEERSQPPALAATPVNPSSGISSLQLQSAAAAASPSFTFNLSSTVPDSSPLFSGNSPSPIVYPTRPPKKLKSLAAVELPTFPRPKQQG